MAQRLIGEAQKGRGQEEVVGELRPGLAQLRQVGGDVRVLGRKRIDVGDVQVVVVPTGAAGEEPTIGTRIGLRAGRRRRSRAGAVARRPDDAGDEDVGTDRAERREHLRLGLVQPLRYADDADHQTDAGGQAERRQDRAP